MNDGAKTKSELLKELKSLRRRVKSLESDIEKLGQTKESPKETNEKYHTIFAYAPVGIYQSTPDGRFKTVNEKLVQILGYSSKEELLKVNIEKDIYSVESERELLINKYEPKGFVGDHQIQCKKKDGSKIWIQLTAVAVKNKSGKTLYFDGFVRDISEQKKIEEELHKNLLFQKQLITSLPTISFITTNLDAIITSFSPGAENIFGYSAKEIIGQPVAKLHLPEDVAKFPEIIQKQKNGQIGYSGEMTLVRKNGERFPAQFLTESVLDDSGNIIALLGVSQDITERKKAGENLKESEERYRQLFQDSPVGIFHYDNDYHITDCNDRFVEILNSKRKSLINLNMHLLNDKSVLPAIEKSLNGEDAFYDGYYGATTSSAKIWISMRTSPIFDAKHQITGGVAIVEDNTVRRKIEEELHESETRMKTLIEATPDAIFFKDGDGRWLLINSAAAELFDLQNVDYQYKTDLELGEIVTFHREALIYCSQSDLKTWESGVLTQSEEIIPGSNGKLRSFDVIKIPLYNMDGSRHGLVIVGRDITERKRAELEVQEALEKVQAEKAKSEAIISAMGDGISIQDLNYKIIYQNDVQKKLLGNQVGKYCYDVYENKEGICKECPVAASFIDGKIHSAERSVLTENGTLNVEITSSPLRDSSGKIVAGIEIVRNINERKQNEEVIWKQLSFAQALNKISEFIISQNNPDEILQSTTNIVGEALKADRCLIYNIALDSNQIIALSEWLNPFDSEITSTKCRYNLDLFKNGSRFMEKTHNYLVSCYKKINENFLSDGSGKLLHEEMKIKSLLWHPFDFRPNNYFVLVLNQVIKDREWKQEEIAFVDSAAHLVTLAFQKMRLLSEHQHTMAELQKSEQRYREVVNNIKEVIFQTDRDGIWTFLNPSWTEITGFTLEESLGQSSFGFVHPDDREMNLHEFLPLIEHKKDFCRHSVRYLTKDGNFKWIEVHARLIIDDNGNTLGTTGTLNDITERMKTEKELLLAKERAESSDKMKTEFLAQVSHEIRTPLHAMLNFSSIIQDVITESGYSDEDITRSFKGIRISGKRIVRTIDLILNMSEVQTGSYICTLRHFSLYDDVLFRVYHDFKSAAEEAKLEYTLTKEDVNTNVIADEYSVTQIINHLIDNAIKFTKEGSIKIRLFKNQEGKLSVTIADTGIGISQEFLTHIFTPFSQEEQGYSRSYEGNGLGLALIKKYCDMNNIGIDVKSQKGIGTTFLLTFHS